MTTRPSGIVNPDNGGALPRPREKEAGSRRLVGGRFRFDGLFEARGDQVLDVADFFLEVFQRNAGFGGLGGAALGQRLGMLVELDRFGWGAAFLADPILQKLDGVYAHSELPVSVCADHAVAAARQSVFPIQLKPSRALAATGPVPKNKF